MTLLKRRIGKEMKRIRRHYAREYSLTKEKDFVPKLNVLIYILDDKLIKKLKMKPIKDF